MVLGALAGAVTCAPQASAQTQAPTTTTLTASPSSAAIGQYVVLSAHLSGCADTSTSLGMSFFEGGDLLATVPIAANGDASLIRSFSTTGTHTVTAVFNASPECAVSYATTNVVVNDSLAPPGPGLLGLNVGDIHIGDTRNVTGSYNNSAEVNYYN
ncbi:Ig-like domain-containing protein [Nonomuraea maritima]|uniref:Ig-like domain-containing protein n=1 Tax=Nonomuraea maritima TaxID=683260 RepID=UPI00371514EB